MIFQGGGRGDRGGGGPDPISLYLMVHIVFWISIFIIPVLMLLRMRIGEGSPEAMQQAEKSHDIVQSRMSWNRGENVITF